MTPPLPLILRLSLLSLVLPTTVACAQTPAPLTGVWTQESSGKELVLIPKIKLQPNVGVSYGTSLGGSVGYGSMTRTVVATEPTLMDVSRAMSLELNSNGTFNWIVVRKHREDESCTRTTTLEKHGTYRSDAGKLTFSVHGGTEDWKTSCGGSGSGALNASTENYAVTITGKAMMLSGGPDRWTFMRR